MHVDTNTSVVKFIHNTTVPQFEVRLSYRNGPLVNRTGFESQSCSFKNDLKTLTWIVGVQFVDCFPRANSLDHVLLALEDLELLRLDST